MDLESVLIGLSVALNVILGLKPVVLWAVKKTKTTKDDEIVEKIYSLLSKVPEDKQKEILDKIK